MRSLLHLSCPAVVALLLLSAALAAGCATTPHKPAVTVEQVIEMSQAGTAPADIVHKMREAGTVYRLSGSELARLKERGVSDEVLDYMQGTNLDDARRRALTDYQSYWGPPYFGPHGYWYGAPGWYGPPYWYSPYWRHRHYPYRSPFRASAPPLYRPMR
jgi:hypothetical protein